MRVFAHLLYLCLRYQRDKCLFRCSRGEVPPGRRNAIQKVIIKQNKQNYKRCVHDSCFFSLIALNDPLSKSQDIKCDLLEDFAPAEILSVSPTCSVMGTRTWFIPRTDFSLI